MTNDQWQQLKDFAIRFAKYHYQKHKNPDLDSILDDIELVFDENDPSKVDRWEDVCDYVSGLYNHVWAAPSVYASDRQCRLLEAYWDRDLIDQYDDLREKIAQQYEAPLHICVRSGIGFISDMPGVIGLTAGDIQVLYPEGLPAWLCRSEWVHKDESINLEDLPKTALILL